MAGLLPFEGRPGLVERPLGRLKRCREFFDADIALAALALESADRHVATPEFLQGFGLRRKAALGILFDGAHAQRKLGPQMIAVGGDFSEG